MIEIGSSHNITTTNNCPCDEAYCVRIRSSYSLQIDGNNFDKTAVPKYAQPLALSEDSSSSSLVWLWGKTQCRCINCPLKNACKYQCYHSIVAYHTNKLGSISLYQ